MIARVAAIALSIASLPALAGPYDQPYALVESGWRSDVRKEHPVSISAVDGHSTPLRRRINPVAPGKHRIDVQLALAPGPSAKQTQTVEIDAVACTRYRVVAHYESRTHIEWTPVVHSEPVGECLRKFGRAQPAASAPRS